MGHKLLFVLGIVAAHGALGAAWLGQESNPAPSAVANCVNTSAPLPHFERPHELVAMRTTALAEVRLQP